MYGGYLKKLASVWLRLILNLSPRFLDCHNFNARNNGCGIEDMLDIKLIRNKPDTIQAICNERGLKVDIDSLLRIDGERLDLLSKIEALRRESNELVSLIKSADSNSRGKLIEKGAYLKAQIQDLNSLHIKVDAAYTVKLMTVPNLYADDTPTGKNEDNNIEIEVFNQHRGFKVGDKDHISIGNLIGMNFEAGTRIAGSGFPLMSGPMAQLEDGILRYAYDRAVADGFIPVNVPLLAKHDIIEGLGFNPRRSDEGSEIFSTTRDDLCLIGTAEIPLVGQYAGVTFEWSQLPIKLVSRTPCFRREGSYGRRDAGLYRNKMFNKVELVVITDEENAASLFEDIRTFEIKLFKDLGIHCRTVRICAGDLGAPAFKKYDLEAWMMGRGEGGDLPGWGELTSCSNCTDYQSRRLNIRYKKSGEKSKFVYTLNGTGITTRAMIPVLEQYQNSDSSITIPEVLRPYLGGLHVLR